MQIQPFQLSSLARYRPYFLAGWMAEEYSVEMEHAIAMTKQEFRKREEQEISRFVPGDTFSSLRVQTEIEVNGSDLVLLPVHVLSYRYRDQVYRFLVNGQTGKVVGQKPYSGRRITAFAIFLLLVLLAIILAVTLLSQANS